jgi:hypothetical protein
MGADVLGDPGPADDPGGTVPVQPTPVPGEEERPFDAPARSLDRSRGRYAARTGS